MGSYRFVNSESAKLNLQKQQLKEIQQLYSDAASNVEKKINGMKDTGSYALQKQNLNSLVTNLKNEVTNVNAQIQEGITNGAKSAAAAVVKEDREWLEKLGIDASGAFTNVPDNVVKQIISGNVYNNSWTLSSAIWGTNEKQLKDIDFIVARGRAENKSSLEIAKDLEKYVNPSAKKDYNWSHFYPGTNRKVDYNAVRLARTMTSHAYQKAFQQVNEKNPFVTGYQWNNGHADTDVCEECKQLAERDGFGMGPGVFPKDQTPLDHPNGYCFLSVVTDMDKAVDRLADWVNGKDDKELDEFAMSMGFTEEQLKNCVNLFKNSNYSNMSYKQAYNNVFKDNNFGKAQDFWKEISTGYKNAGYANKEEYWQALLQGKVKNQNVEELLGLKKQYDVTKDVSKKVATTFEEVLDKYGKSDNISISNWVYKLTDEEQKIVKNFKNSTGQKWDDFFKEHILSDKGKVKLAKKEAKNATKVATKEVNTFEKAASKFKGKDIFDFDEKVVDAIYDSYFEEGNFKAYESAQEFFNDFLSGKIKDKNLEEKVFGEVLSESKATVKKATKPIVSDFTSENVPHYSEWIDLCKKNKLDHMLELEKQSFQEIGDEGLSGLRSYTGNSYRKMNAYLRNIKSGMSQYDAEFNSGISAYQLEDLKKAQIGLGKTKTTETLVLRRGSSNGDIAGILFEEGDNPLEHTLAKRKLNQEISDLGIDGFNAKYSGSIGKFGGFTSTSSLWDRGFTGDYEYMFYVPEGTDCSSIMNISQFGTSEGETLLNINTKVRFHHIEISDGHMGSDYRVFFEVIS